MYKRKHNNYESRITSRPHRKPKRTHLIQTPRQAQPTYRSSIISENVFDFRRCRSCSSSSSFFDSTTRSMMCSTRFRRHDFQLSRFCSGLTRYEIQNMAYEFVYGICNMEKKKLLRIFECIHSHYQHCHNRRTLRFFLDDVCPSVVMRAYFVTISTQSNRYLEPQSAN